MLTARLTLAAILLTLCGAASAATPQEHLDFVCAVRALDCRELAPPAVKVVPMQPLGQYRLWSDPDSVYVSVLVRDPVLFEGIVAHEISHYVDYKLGLAPLSERLWYEARPLYINWLCESEGQAWRAYNAWALWHRLPPGYFRYNWLASYPMCSTRHLR
jgi:hypothetical protein